MGRLKVKNDISIPFKNSRERYGVQLNVEKVPMWIACLDLEIIAMDQGDGTQVDETPL
jgi:hypothetical protein